MLDAPVFLRGKMVGVVCHEHTKTARRWQQSEELLAGTFADFVALVLETSAWHQAEEALRVERDAIASKVVDRTRELAESEANLRALVDFSPVAMVLTRISDSKIVLANRRAAAMFEVPLHAIQGRYPPDHWVDLDARARYLEQVMSIGRVDDFEAELRGAGGRTFWAHLSGQRLRFGGDDALLAAIVDVTAQRQAHEEMRVLATHDQLTGIFNRRHVEDLVRKELERAQRHSRPLTVAMMDADHFKAINDSHGHQVGDEVLRAIASRCQQTLRANDVFGRYGGEEFVVVFPGDRPGGGGQRRGAAARRGRGGADHRGRCVAGRDGVDRPGGVRARPGHAHAVPARRRGAVRRQGRRPQPRACRRGDRRLTRPGDACELRRRCGIS